MSPLSPSSLPSPRACVLAACLLPWVFAACSNSGGHRGDPRLLAEAVIGPEGGQIAVTQGAQAGLLFTVPAGAVAAPVRLQVFDASMPSGVAAVSGPGRPAEPFRIQPVDVSFALPAVLRAPYRADRIVSTAPGNVVLQQIGPSATVALAPAAIHIDAGWLEVSTSTLGLFEVIPGTIVNAPIGYLSPVGTTVQLADGFTFAVEEVPAGSPFGTGNTRWHVTGPGTDDLLYFAGDLVTGRESLAENWRETWTTPCTPWTSAAFGQLVQTQQTQIQVSAPIGVPPLGGSLTVFAFWRWAAPQTIGGVLLRDVLELRATLAWARPDLGVGQREYRLLFAAGVGLIGFTQDGVQHLRTSL